MDDFSLPANLQPFGEQISGDEFMRRHHRMMWPNQAANCVAPESGYFAAGGEISIYSGVRDYYRPVTRWEKLKFLSYVRLRYLNKRRWQVCTESDCCFDILPGAFRFLFSAVLWGFWSSGPLMFRGPVTHTCFHDRLTGRVLRPFPLPEIPGAEERASLRYRVREKRREFRGA